MPAQSKSASNPSRFAEKMAKIKIPGLRKSRTSMVSKSSSEESSLKTASSSSVLEENSSSGLRFDFTGAKVPCTSSSIVVNFLPLTSSPPLYLAIVLAKDSPGEYECQSDRKQREGNDIRMAKRKLRMAALGRRCFRLEEEWAEDSLSNKENSVMHSIAKVHVIRSEKTVAEIQSLETARDGAALLNIASAAVDKYFQYFQNLSVNSKRHVAVLMFDAKDDLRIEGLINHSALSNEIGVCGTRSLYTFPSCLEEVVPAFTDCTRIEGNSTSVNETTDLGSFWEAATSAMGNMIEAFISPQQPVQPRELDRINRTFTTKEPYSFKTKSAGLRICLPQEECNWSRVDCLRLRHHPCFRLPTDPVITAGHDNPQIYAIENGMFASASSGIFLVEIYTDDTYRAHLEFTTKIEREVQLLESELREKLPQDCRSKVMKLKIYSAGQGQTIIDDFSATKGAKVQLPNGYGVAYKSSSLGLSDTDGSKPQEVYLHTLTPGRILTSIRVFHSTALDGLEFVYEDSSSQLFGHRGDKNDRKTEISDFSLDTRKGESLLGFSVRAGSWVDGIEILTSLGRRSPLFGNPHGGTSSTLIPPRGRSIAGVSGSCAQCVDGFSILYK
ncbi:putative peptidase family-domain-containing protein [Morchella snyderi]|nr:putative peptidase family-domain-containing protein [Morchella snyderi]